MGQKFVGDIRALGAQPPDGAVEIHRVPVNDRGGDEAQPRGAEPRATPYGEHGEHWTLTPEHTAGVWRALQAASVAALQPG